MLCRHVACQPGEFWPVRDSYHYPLPKGLPAGSVVKLSAFDHGYWTVEHEGRQFVVFLTLIDSGFEYEVRGRWFPENHEVIARQRKFAI